MQKSAKKTFILDTYVILHDSACIRQFAENDVIVLITVLEELDNFKKGNGSLNYHAREFLRELDALTDDCLVNGGIPLGPGLGKIRIELEQPFHEELIQNFSTEKRDHHILNISFHLLNKTTPNHATLVTKDVNLLKGERLELAELASDIL